MVACMIPKGKMMANMLKMNEPGSFSLLKFQASQKESEQEKNKILEEEFLTFMEKGITNIRKDGMIIQFQNQFKPLLCHFSYRQKLDNCGWGRWKSICRRWYQTKTWGSSKGQDGKYEGKWKIWINIFFCYYLCIYLHLSREQYNCGIEMYRITVLFMSDLVENWSSRLEKLW